MKFKTLIIPALFALGLTACDKSSEISGTYENSNNEVMSIEKSKDGKKYVISTRIIININGQDKKLPYKVVTYKKENKLYELGDNSLIGTIDKDNILLNKNGKTYKKKF